MPRLRFLLLLMLATSLPMAQQALAQQAQQKGNAPGGKPTEGERLLLPVPKGWKTITNETHKKGEVQVSVKEMIPSSQSPDKWTDRISASSWHGLSKQPLEASFSVIKSVVDENCEKPAYGNQKAGLEHGYPTGIQLIVCAKTKVGNAAEAFIYKTINGKDDLYQVNVAWRLPPAADPDHVALTQDMVNKATAYLKTVYVCDTRDSQHPCPPGK